MKNVLIIKKDVEMAEGMAEILRLTDYDVLISSSPKQAFEVIAQCLPDLIICDIDLETSEDLGVLTGLKNIDGAADIPFVFMGSGEELDEARLGMNLGADDFLIEPIDSVDLINTVTIRLNKSKFVRSKKIEPAPKLTGSAKGWETLDRISANQEIRNYARKEFIFNAGQSVRYLYVVKKGRVKIFKANKLGKELVTDIHLPGDFFAAEALVFDVANCTNAMALENSELLLIPRKIFLQTLKDDPNFASLVIDQFAQTIRQKEKRMLSMAYDSVRKRIADILISLSDHTPAAESGVRVLREDISNMVGTAKESVSRILSEFKEEKLIEISSGRINILRRDSLASIAG